MTAMPSKYSKAQASGAKVSLAVFILVGGLASGPATASAAAAWRPSAARLSGIWVGESRNRTSGGSYRRQRVVLRLRAYPKTRRLTGHLGLRVGVGRAFGGLLTCNKKNQAQVGRGAELAVGRFNRAGLRFRLQKLKLTGERRCGIHSPVAQVCDARPAGAAGLALVCGPLKMRLRKASPSGVWAADIVRTDRSGDGVERHLRLHLRQKDGQLSGLLDQIQVQVSNDGQKYRCNGRLRFSRQQRYRVDGTFKGLELRMRRRKTISRAGPCQSPRPLIPPGVLARWDPLGDRLELRFGDASFWLRRLPGLTPATAPAPAPAPRRP